MKDTTGIAYGSRLVRKAKTFRIVRQAVFAAGVISAAVGVIGVFLPVLPTTPFLLLSAACFAFSSKRAYEWLINNRWFGDYIKNYREGRGLTRRAKAAVIGLLWLSMGLSIYAMSSLVVRGALFAIGVAVTAHILMLPSYSGD